MIRDHSPLVSVVTPVHNGERYFAACIESVLQQRYSPLEYVIVDNASTDTTPKIIDQYASWSSRIKHVRCEQKLPVLENWNRALEYVSERSAYVWVLPADDAMLGESVAAMMEVAIANPSVGIISSLRQRGHVIQNGGLPQDKNVFSGRDIGRLFLRREIFPFSPTGSIIRRDVIEANKPFYIDGYVHGDTAAFFNVLHGIDFGFVHDVLMFSRVHEGSITASIADRRGSQIHDGLLMLLEFGHHYLAPQEYREVLEDYLRWYCRFVLRGMIMRREPAFFEYHFDALHRANYHPGLGAYSRALLGELYRALMHPRRAFAHIQARLQMLGQQHRLWSAQRQT